MSITLTCPCGQQQFVANELAGRTSACVMCGQALDVPALGVAERPKVRPKITRARPSRVPLILLAVGILFLLLTGGVLLAWQMLQTFPVEPTPIAQKLPPTEQRDVVQLPRDRQRPEPEKKPSIVEEPIPTKELPKKLVLPIKLNEPPKQIAAPIKPKSVPRIAAGPLKLLWKLREGETFFQEVIVTQKPTFKIGGLPVASVLNYRIVSRFRVTKQEDDGSLAVEQKIESAKLLQADDLSRSTVEGAIAKMPGTTYSLHMSPQMDVTRFQGGASGLKIAGFDLGGGIGMQMASLIDRDGWKELAQATFFQLDQTPRANLRWSKPLTHHWGSLGSWTGQTHYAYLGQQKNLHKISYQLQLAYKAPAGGAIGLMTVNGANFQPPVAGGVLLFDADKGKIVSAEERFQVKGVINVNLLGQNTLIEIAEDQHFLIRIHDRMIP